MSGNRLDDRDSVAGRSRDFTLRHHVQIGTETHRASYPTGKATRAWSLSPSYADFKAAQSYTPTVYVLSIKPWRRMVYWR